MTGFSNTDKYKAIKKKRKGVHAKTKTSRNKNSKLYIKLKRS